MNTIRLKGMEFFGYHGFYEEEQKNGNRFIVDLSVTIPELDAFKNDDLSDTVNYEELYAITSEEMSIPSKLLENVCHRVAKRIMEELGPKGVLETEISIKKQNPPLGGLCAYSEVSYRKKS